jgi:hypothetical protein
MTGSSRRNDATIIAADWPAASEAALLLAQLGRPTRTVADAPAALSSGGIDMIVAPTSIPADWAGSGAMAGNRTRRFAMPIPGRASRHDRTRRRPRLRTRDRRSRRRTGPARRARRPDGATMLVAGELSSEANLRLGEYIGCPDW